MPKLWTFWGCWTQCCRGRHQTQTHTASSNYVKFGLLFCDFGLSVRLGRSCKTYLQILQELILKLLSQFWVRFAFWGLKRVPFWLLFNKGFLDAIFAKNFLGFLICFWAFEVWKEDKVYALFLFGGGFTGFKGERTADFILVHVFFDFRGEGEPLVAGLGLLGPVYTLVFHNIIKKSLNRFNRPQYNRINLWQPRLPPRLIILPPHFLKPRIPDRLHGIWLIWNRKVNRAQPLLLLNSLKTKIVPRHRHLQLRLPRRFKQTEPLWRLSLVNFLEYSIGII